MDYKRKYLKYKQKYLELQKNLFGGADDDVKVDNNGALILDNQGNENGNYYCWLNAPLYAFVAFKDVVDLYTKNFCLEKGGNPLVKDDDIPKYKRIYNLMLEARQKNTVWNNDFYKKIHTEICKYTECGDTENIIALNSGRFSNPQPVIDLFKNVLVKNCPDTKSPLYVENFNTKVSDFNAATVLGDKYGKKLIAIVKGVELVDEINNNNEKIEIGVGHFIAYVRNNNDDKWKNYDGGKTTEEYTYSLDTIFPKNTNVDKYWVYFGIYFNKDYSFINEDPTKEEPKSQAEEEEEEEKSPEAKEMKKEPEVKEIESVVKPEEIKPVVKPEAKVAETKQKRTLGGIETLYKSFPLMTPKEFAKNKDYLPNIVKPF